MTYQEPGRGRIMRQQRYEILLPLKHNDGRPLNPELFELTRGELLLRFTQVSLFPQAVLDLRLHEGNRSDELLLRVVVECDDTPENLEYFLQLKPVLLERFGQIELDTASHPVDIL